MGVFTPSQISPNRPAYGDRDHHMMVTPRADDRLESAPYPPLDLELVLGSLAPLPPYSVLLGICEDGLPLLLDFKNPASGSILLLGDPQQANRPLLRSLLASAVLLNTAEEVQLYLITAEGEAFAEFQEVPGAMEIISPYDDAALELVWYFACRAKEQDCSRQSRGVEVLLIEDLAVFVTQLDPQGRRELDWLVTAGSQVGSWVIGGHDAAGFGEINDPLLAAFRTQLIGIADAKQPEVLSRFAEEINDELVPGAQYSARISGEFVRFWLPRYTFVAQPEKRVVKGTTR